MLKILLFFRFRFLWQFRFHGLRLNDGQDSTGTYKDTQPRSQGFSLEGNFKGKALGTGLKDTTKLFDFLAVFL